MINEQSPFHDHRVAVYRLIKNLSTGEHPLTPKQIRLEYKIASSTIYAVLNGEYDELMKNSSHGKKPLVK